MQIYKITDTTDGKYIGWELDLNILESMCYIGKNLLAHEYDSISQIGNQIRIVNSNYTIVAVK